MEKENSEKKTSKPKKSSQKKVAPSVPPPVVVTPEKEEIKLVEDEPSVKGLRLKITVWLTFKDFLRRYSGCDWKQYQADTTNCRPSEASRRPKTSIKTSSEGKCKNRYKLFSVPIIITWQIPDLIDIPVAEEDDDEEEKEEKIEKESPKPKIGFPLPGLGKVDLSSVKLRETKPKNKSLKLVRPATTIEPRPQTLPGWMELTTELGKKQARRSEIFLDKNSPEDLSPTSPLPSQISR